MPRTRECLSETWADEVDKQPSKQFLNIELTQLEVGLGAEDSTANLGRDFPTIVHSMSRGNATDEESVKPKERAMCEERIQEEWLMGKMIETMSGCRKE